MTAEPKTIVKLPHHEQQEYCLNRPPYRQGRKLTSVKVYTVNDESQHLLVFGVPQIKLKDELYRLACKYGIVKALTLVNQQKEDADDESNKFTDTYHLHYRRIQAARFAKRQLDERCFFGGVLHVCYAPEFETVMETRVKLVQRRREVAARLEANKNSAGTANITKSRVPQRSRKHPALPLTEERLKQCASEGLNYSNTNLLPGSSITGNRGPISLKPSPQLLQACSAEYGSFSFPNKTFNEATTSSFEGNFVSQLPQSCTSSTTGALPFIMPPVNSFNRSSYHTNSGNIPSQLSDQEIKSLCFVPRQITLPSTTKMSNKNSTKKRIVFYNKK